MSSNRQLHFSVSERRTPDSIRREVMLTADGESDTTSVLYDIFDTAVGDLAVLDGLVQGVMLHCMRRGLPLRIHGTVSSQSMHNLHELQRAWARWRPETYHHIDLIPDAIVTESPRSDKTIQAFSGGVDASFTLIANKYLHKNRGGYDVTAAVLVHGFDVSYDNTQGFYKLVERVRKTLDQTGVDIKLVRTNSKTLNLQSWMDSYSCQLSACLHQFANHYGKALIGSNRSYDAIKLPLGSNPITDSLLSGDLMKVIHDGAGYSRTEKVEAISRYPLFVQQLKVCWEGHSQYENCGDCEKCLRTRLNFAAVHLNEPSCFPSPFNAKMLRRLRAKTQVQIAELEGILTFVRRRRLAYPWVKSLRRQIILSRLAIAIEKAIGWHTLRPRLRSALGALRRKRERTRSHS